MVIKFQKLNNYLLKVEYKKAAKSKIDKDFTVLEKRPDVDHAVNTAKMQSQVSRMLQK